MITDSDITVKVVARQGSRADDSGLRFGSTSTASASLGAKA
jgi:hypothetical protein